MQNKDTTDFFVYNSPINDVRLRTWERRFPGCGDDFGEIFGTMMPTPKEVAAWKESWFATTPYQMPVEVESFDDLLSNRVKVRINDVANRCGIHPYFWEYWKRQEKDWENGSEHTIILNPTVSFYKEEHLVMFKLAWW